VIEKPVRSPSLSGDNVTGAAVVTGCVVGNVDVDVDVDVVVTMNVGRVVGEFEGDSHRHSTPVSSTAMQT
jgi:hypothetical protein